MMEPNPPAPLFPVAVIGGGPAGLTTAIALAHAGLRTLLIAPRPARADYRTTALLQSSIAALTTLGVWERCAADAAPLRCMRIVDDTERLLRAPEVLFEASEIDLDAFGYNIDNRNLLTALESRAADLPLITRVTAEAAAIAVEADRVVVTLHSGERLATQLVAGADGRKSMCREAAGIGTRTDDLPQVALTFNLAHTRDHKGVSTELHRAGGPFTLVPLPGRRSSLVHVTDAKDAAELAALDDAALSLVLEKRAHSILGKFSFEPGRGVFPLTPVVADCFARDRIALVGESGHVLPPIGAQGLNLGLRDAATLAEVVADALAADHAGDAGAPDILADYDRRRRADVTTRAFVVDLLNRSLLSDFLPVQSARQLGFLLLDRIGPMRRAVMREGIMPSAAQPRLMRGEPLAHV